jgi:hypothetical protein
MFGKALIQRHYQKRACTWLLAPIGPSFGNVLNLRPYTIHQMAYDRYLNFELGLKFNSMIVQYNLDEVRANNSTKSNLDLYIAYIALHKGQ